MKPVSSSVNGIAHDGEANGTASGSHRRAVTAASFRALQARLKSRPAGVPDRTPAPPPVIPDLGLTAAESLPALEYKPAPPAEEAAPPSAPAEPAPPAGEEAPAPVEVEEPVPLPVEEDMAAAAAEEQISPPVAEEQTPPLVAEETPPPPVEGVSGEHQPEPAIESVAEGAAEVEALVESDPFALPTLAEEPESSTTLADELLDATIETAAGPQPAAETAEPVEAEQQSPVNEPVVEAPAEPQAPEDLLRPLAEKFSGTAALLKKVKSTEDPFSETSSGIASELPAPEEPAVLLPPDPQSGEVARSLLDIMSAPSGTSQPQERALAADTLLRLMPRLPLKNLIGLVERVCLMEAPPQLLVRRLIRDPRVEVAGLLLERGTAISDQDLMAVIGEHDAAKQRLIARRRTISPALADAIIDAGDAGALLTLVRNPGATFAIESFHRLGQLAAEMPALQAPLATRLDTPAPVAFELFWFLPAELRRYILSRFLTDSETLNKILKIALAVGSDSQDAPADVKFPDKGKVEEFITALSAAGRPSAALRLAELAGISEANAERIIADKDGEPMTVAFKVLGLTRARFGEVIDLLRQSPEAPLRSDRNITDLQNIFDSLSFNKARVLLTYWDWAAQHTGPYARGSK